MNQQPMCDLIELAAAVPDGAKLVVPSDNCGVAMAATREQMKGASRHEVQHTLMPYQHLLPESLRGRNERVGEPL